MKRKIINILSCLIIIILTIVVFLYSNQITHTFYDTLIFILKVILPSLFPFMIFINFILNSNCIDYISYIFKPIGKLLNISGYGISVIIASILGGFPYSAILVEHLVKNNKINKVEGERLSYFLFFPSFSFLYTSLYLKDSKILLCLYSIYITSFSFLYFSKFNKKYKVNFNNNTKFNIKNNFDDLYFQVSSSCYKSIFSISFCIIFFSIISSLLTNFINNEYILNILSGLLEFSKTSITIINKENKSFIDYFSINLILSFSSFSIIIQSYFYLKNVNIKIKKLLFFRVAISLISSIIFTIVYIIC